jgi:two-component system sensor histidine kinase TctE
LNEVLTFQNRFIADAAHQLRTPVAGLKTHIELALREENAEDRRRSLSHLATSVERMSRLVSQLMALAKYEARSVRMQSFSPLDLGSLAFQVTTSWVPDAYRKNIDLGFEGPHQTVIVKGDSLGLTELLNNLIDNAIRYTPEDGRITVRLQSGAQPQLSVSDDGPGIPEADRERVFERFYRLLGSHKDGSGLGLSIVREIASLHDAQVTLTGGANGKGNTFTVVFSESYETEPA